MTLKFKILLKNVMILVIYFSTIERYVFFKCLSITFYNKLYEIEYLLNLAIDIKQ